jgi:hypothetical protein
MRVLQNGEQGGDVCSPYSVLTTKAAPDYTAMAAGGAGQDALAGTPRTVKAQQNMLRHYNRSSGYADDLQAYMGKGTLAEKKPVRPFGTVLRPTPLTRRPGSPDCLSLSDSD